MTGILRGGRFELLFVAKQLTGTSRFLSRGPLSIGPPAEL